MAYFIFKILKGLLFTLICILHKFEANFSVLDEKRLLVDLIFFSIQALESFYEKFDPDFIDIRTKAREVLQREDDLNEIVQV